MKGNPIWTGEEWDKLARQHIGPYSHAYPRHGSQIKQALDKYQVSPKRILEVAALSTKDSRFLANELPDCEFYAVDFSREAVDWAREANAEAGLRNIHIVRADAFTLPFESRSFDVSFCADFYVYFQRNDILRLFQEQKRVTKDLIIAFVHNKYNVYRLFHWYMANIKNDPWYEFGTYSLKELRNIFAEEEIVDSGGIDSYALSLVNTMGKGFIGRPVCPKFLRERINQIGFFRSPMFAQINYLVIKASL